MKLMINSGTPLACDNCAYQWAPKRQITASKTSGVRCPKCHSRYIRYKKSGSWVVPSRKKKRAEKLGAVAASPEPEPEVEPFDTREPDTGKLATFRTESDDDSPSELSRDEKIASLKSRLTTRRGPRPSNEEAEVEDEPPEVEEEKPKQLATDILPLDEIIDVETLQSLHDLELNFLLATFDVKRASSHEKLIVSMSKKVQRMIQLILADLTIPNALKVLLILYAIQQVALVTSIAAERKPKPKTPPGQTPPIPTK